MLYPRTTAISIVRPCATNC